MRCCSWRSSFIDCRIRTACEVGDTSGVVTAAAAAALLMFEFVYDAEKCGADTSPPLHVSVLTGPI